jgi:hypothetical protein
MATLKDALLASDEDWTKPLGASRAVVTLCEQGTLHSPRLSIAREIEGDVLDVRAGHAKFGEITQTELVTMIIGARAFIEKHLP